MRKRKMLSILISFCLIMILLLWTECGLRPNDKTEQIIRNNIPSMVKPITDFHFLDDSKKDTLFFEFRAANGSLYRGTFDGERLSFNIAD